MTPVEKLLREARELIREPGDWCKGSFNDGCGRRCAVGALTYAAFRGLQQNESTLERNGECLAAQRLLDAAAFETHRKALIIVNDLGDTTHGEILAIYDLAIEWAG